VRLSQTAQRSDAGAAFKVHPRFATESSVQVPPKEEE
jgi:hypothetical protein